MTPVFVDTSAFIAVLVESDTNHRSARRTFERLLTDSSPMMTHNYVVLETFAVLQTRVGLDCARSFELDIMPVVFTEWVRPEDHDIGVGAVLAAGRKKLSLVDCVSFALLRRLGVQHAFAFDRHFAQQGLKMVG